jgi:hypothetical protein
MRANPNAFPKKVLRLNLLSGDTPDEDGILYDFRFLDDARAAKSEAELWFKVPDIVGMASGPAMLKWLVEQGLTDNKLTKAYTVLDRLHRTIHAGQLLFYYEEEAQELERVLNIFIRLRRVIRFWRSAMAARDQRLCGGSRQSAIQGRDIRRR